MPMEVVSYTSYAEIILHTIDDGSKWGAGSPKYILRAS